MTEHTVVEPTFEFIDPSMPYLKFLEYCTRKCYRSEEKAKEGSAEKLLNKVVKERGHISVIEHANCIFWLNCGDFENFLMSDVLPYVPLFAYRYSSRNPESCGWFLSGNLRMWLELMTYHIVNGSMNSILMTIYVELHKIWPFFFTEKFIIGKHYIICMPIDSNPFTNINNLTISEMRQHMTLTYNLIGDRSFSHQLVRHRIASYSQESQRFCDYGKKGYQFILPPTIDASNEDIRELWFGDILEDYETYLKLREAGVPPEDARSKFPNAAKTEVVMTQTLCMWDHSFDQRARNKHAQWQIKKIMGGIEHHMITVKDGVLDKVINCKSDNWCNVEMADLFKPHNKRKVELHVKQKG